MEKKVTLTGGDLNVLTVQIKDIPRLRSRFERLFEETRKDCERLGLEMIVTQEQYGEMKIMGDDTNVRALIENLLSRKVIYPVA